MNLPKLLFFFVILSICCSSCSRKVYFQDAYQANVEENLSKVEVDIQTKFSGDALDYLVFELDVKNNSSDSIELHYKNISLQITDFDNNREEFSIEPIYKEDVIDYLFATKGQAKRNRNARNVEAAFGIGVGILGILSGGGGNGWNTVNSVVYTLDVASIVVEDNRAYALIAGDIDEQIQYIDDWVLESCTIAPNESVSYDILFERVMITGDADFTIQNDKIDYSDLYELEVVVEKIR